MRKRGLTQFVLSLTGYLIVAACADSDNLQTDIVFDARYRDTSLACGVSFGPGHSLSLTDLRFYVADLAMRNANGAWISVAAATSKTGISLMDFEDASAECANGTEETNNRIPVIVPGGHYDGLRFTLGVPFELNHADPLAAEYPLNEPAMHWHWQSGYKFIRAGVRAGDRRWHVHLGSTGCEGPATAVTNCERPNRATVRIENWSPQEPIIVSIDALLSGISLANAAGDHCLGDVAAPACRAVMKNLGLDADTGMATGASSVFRTDSR